MPGQHSYENKNRILKDEVMELKDELVNNINSLAKLLKISQLISL